HPPTSAPFPSTTPSRSRRQLRIARLGLPDLRQTLPSRFCEAGARAVGIQPEPLQEGRIKPASPVAGGNHDHLPRQVFQPHLEVALDLRAKPVQLLKYEHLPA